MDFIRLTISCLTGLGVLVLIATLLFVAWLLNVIRQEKHKKPVETEPLAVDWEAVLQEVQK